MEDILWPILDRYTSSEGQDIFEEVMQLATYLTYFPPTISPRMWTLYPRMLQVWGRRLAAACGAGCVRERSAAAPAPPTHQTHSTRVRTPHAHTHTRAHNTHARTHARNTGCPLLPRRPLPPPHTQHLQCVGDWAIDYFEEVLLPLDNFIRWGGGGRKQEERKQGESREISLYIYMKSREQGPCCSCTACRGAAGPGGCLPPLCPARAARARTSPHPILPPPVPPHAALARSKGTEVFLTSQTPNYLALTNQVCVVCVVLVVVRRRRRRQRQLDSRFSFLFCGLLAWAPRTRTPDTQPRPHQHTCLLCPMPDPGAGTVRGRVSRGPGGVRSPPDGRDTAALQGARGPVPG